MKWPHSEIKAGQNLSLEYRSMPGGVDVLEAFHSSMTVPVAMVWFRFSYDGHNEILWSYVREPYRRLGLRTRINQKLAADYPDRGIVTQAGSKTGGKAFMKASGYKRTGTAWILPPKAKKERRKKCS